jgi:hypothetical protein
MNRKIAPIVALLALALCSTAHADDQANRAVMLSLGMAVGIELVCGMDTKPDTDLAFSFARSVDTKDLDKVFTAGFGGGSGLRNDHNFPAICTTQVSDLLAKAQYARDYAASHR